jgi:hypothetical protein
MTVPVAHCKLYLSRWLRSLCIGMVAQHDPGACASCTGRLEAHGACSVAPLPPLATGRTACGRTATTLLCADVDSADEGVLPCRCTGQSARRMHRSAPAEEPPANTYPSASPAAADPEAYSWSVHYPYANNGRYGCAIPSRCPEAVSVRAYCALVQVHLHMDFRCLERCIRSMRLPATLPPAPGPPVPHHAYPAVIYSSSSPQGSSVPSTKPTFGHCLFILPVCKHIFRLLRPPLFHTPTLFPLCFYPPPHTPSSCVIKSSNGTRSASVSTTSTPSTNAAPRANVDTMCKRRRFS